jgi:hypothetical protein
MPTILDGGMQNAKNFRVMFSSIQNAEFIVSWEHLEDHFGFFRPLEVKIQNGE